MNWGTPQAAMTPTQSNEVSAHLLGHSPGGECREHHSFREKPNMAYVCTRAALAASLFRSELLMYAEPWLRRLSA